MTTFFFLVHIYNDECFSEDIYGGQLAFFWWDLVRAFFVVSTNLGSWNDLILRGVWRAWSLCQEHVVSSEAISLLQFSSLGYRICSLEMAIVQIYVLDTIDHLYPLSCQHFPTVPQSHALIVQNTRPRLRLLLTPPHLSNLDVAVLRRGQTTL